DVWMRSELKLSTMLGTEVSKIFLFLMRHACVFLTPVYEHKNHIGTRCLSSDKVCSNQRGVKRVNDVRLRNCDTIGAVRIIQQSQTKTVLFQDQWGTGSF